MGSGYGLGERREIYYARRATPTPLGPHPPTHIYRVSYCTSGTCAPHRRGFGRGVGILRTITVKREGGSNPGNG
jgi:hypothetical protein